MSTLKVDTINEKSTNGNIAVIPTGNGTLVLDGLTWPNADGSANQLLKSNGSGVLSFVDAPSSGFTQGTEQATTSGTSVTFGSIPAGVDMIVINFVSVSINSTADLLIQIGDAGGIETGSYLSTRLTFDGGTVGANSTSGFLLGSTQEGAIISGSMSLMLEDAAAYHWVESHVIKFNTAQMSIGAGDKALSAELTQLKISGGTFDAGAINIMYQ
tara:strand:- start:1107 stop:1748 length:642 start_codon:yes stop_codon:yes gene_type:complete